MDGGGRGEGGVEGDYKSLAHALQCLFINKSNPVTVSRLRATVCDIIWAHVQTLYIISCTYAACSLKHAGVFGHKRSSGTPVQTADVGHVRKTFIIPINYLLLLVSGR